MPRLNLRRSWFFWNLYLSYAAILLLTTGVIWMLVVPRTEWTLERHVVGAIQSQCELLKPFARRAIDEAGGEQAGAALEDMGRISAASGVRVTLIRGDGVVVFDSEEDAERMENHRNRREVIEAFSHEYGTARRVSKTVDRAMLYVAAVLPGGGRDVVRVAIPMQEVEEELASLRRRLALGAGIGIAVALLLGLFATRRFTLPVAEITRVADDFRHHRYDSRVRRLPQGELGILGATLNELGSELAARIATISKDDAQLRAMLAGMIEGVVAVDDEDRIVFCNRAATRLFGMAQAPPAGAHLWELVRLAELHRLLEGVRAEQTPASGELVVPGEARRRILEAHANPYRTAEASGVVVVLHDMTELRRLEGIRRDFVANVSHELKTPLTSIKGYVETLLGLSLIHI